MNRLEKVRGPAYNEIAGILQADKEILEIMLEDKARQQQFEKLKALLQKDAEKKKEYNDEVIAAMDISAHLKHIKLSILFNAQKEEILKALELDTLHFSETLRLKEQYIEEAVKQQTQFVEIEKANHPSFPLKHAQKLLESALQKEADLQSIIARFNLLQEQVNNWEMQQWRPTVTAAAKITAQAISAQVSIDLASDPTYQTLSSALEAVSNKNLGIIAEEQQELEANLAEVLGNRASADNLLRIVPALADEIIDKNNDSNDGEQKKAIMAKKIEPIYQLRNDVILAANLYKFYNHIKQLCLHHGLEKTYKKELDSWNVVRKAVKQTNGSKYQTLLNGYHSNIKNAYNSNIDDQEVLYKLARSGETTKTSLIDVMNQLKELDLHPENQAGLNLRNKF